MANKSKVFLAGGGKIARMIANFLSNTNDYELTVVDQSSKSLSLFSNYGVETKVCDLSDIDVLSPIISGHDYVLNVGPYHLTPIIAKAAKDAGAHYADLTEDVASTQTVKSLAENADTVFMPQCGLAPGFISIVANDLAQRFETLENLHMRVGALPQFPTNALKYNLTWSTEGLINEYCNPCDAIVDGKLEKVMPLEGHEKFALDGVEYEAFNTSGGLGSLCETLKGKVKNLNYRTVRYPGHVDIIRLLINDLKLRDRRHILKEILEGAVPMTTQDVILIFVTASGYRDGMLMQESYASKIYSREVNGEVCSAIQISTAAGICAALDLFRQGQLSDKGFIRQEQIPLDVFLKNRFGRYFDTGSHCAKPEVKWAA